ncbi:YceI family protein [Pseudidiomarina homiensis]|uniref:YceI family protein n=1 Tax=Pseudidiomarina homiensis TaxID=364198 RepID=UPI00215A180A|nr:YceI family protein [Pseudidiomarina homiensis]
MLKSLLTTAAAATLLSTSAFAADWTLDSERSTLHFVSVKNDTIAEIHRFTKLSGEMNDGELQVTIPVASIDTAIPIRNERMLEHLFNADEYASVTATATIPTEIYDIETATGTLPVVVPMKVFIAGEAVEVDAALQVTKLDADHVVATTSQPVLINASEFKLVAGINKLQEIAGLQAIDHVIPVTFTVQFSREN